MGWLFTQGQTRNGLIEERIKECEFNGKKWSCLAHALRGNVLWKVWEIMTVATNERERFIACDLLGSKRGYGWGYKDMEESMGPCYYTCPLSFFKLVPEPPPGYAVEWREKVKKYHARMRRKFKVGEKIVVGEWEMEVLSLKPLVATRQGTPYRVRKSQVA